MSSLNLLGQRLWGQLRDWPPSTDGDASPGQPGRQSRTLCLIITRRLKNRILFKHLRGFPAEKLYERNCCSNWVCLVCLRVCESVERVCRLDPGPPKVMGDRCAGVDSEMCPLPGGQGHADPGRGPLLVSLWPVLSPAHTALCLQPLTGADEGTAFWAVSRGQKGAFFRLISN